jgi:plastocyanin
VLPILMPVGILLLIGAVLFGFSRILLSVTHDAATATALIVAFGIMVTAGVVATRAVVKPANLVAMIGAVAGVAMLAGGIALVALAPSGAGEGGGEGGGGGGGGAPTVNVVAQGIKFDTAQIDLPAGIPSTIHFENKDPGVQHNIAIFPSENDLQNPLFQGEIITGPDAIDYQVPALDPGTYYFHCDIHPTMNGKVVVAEGGGGGGGGGASPTAPPGGGGGPTTSAVVAEGITFDTAEIRLPADQAVTLTFQNNDAGIQHNIAIFPSESDLQDPLFRGEIITGPDSIDYQIPALQPGTYYFHCDIHPNMNGTVIVG